MKYESNKRSVAHNKAQKKRAAEGSKVTMKNENNKRSPAHNKTQKKRAVEGSKEIRTDPPSSGGHIGK